MYTVQYSRSVLYCLGENSNKEFVFPVSAFTKKGAVKIGEKCVGVVEVFLLMSSGREGAPISFKSMFKA